MDVINSLNCTEDYITSFNLLNHFFIPLTKLFLYLPLFVTPSTPNISQLMVALNVHVISIYFLSFYSILRCILVIVHVN